MVNKMCEKMSSIGGAVLTNNISVSGTSFIKSNSNTVNNSVNHTSFYSIFLVGDIYE